MAHVIQAGVFGRLPREVGIELIGALGPKIE